MRENEHALNMMVKALIMVDSIREDRKGFEVDKE